MLCTLNFKKAFDSVPHQELLLKLELLVRYGFGLELICLPDFRKQQLIIAHLIYFLLFLVCLRVVSLVQFYFSFS